MMATIGHPVRVVPAADSPALPSRQRAERVAGQFEEIFVREFVAKMRETIPTGSDDGLFGSGPGADIYTQWFDTLMAHELAAGGSVGVAETLIADWERSGLVGKQRGGGDDHGA